MEERMQLSIVLPEELTKAFKEELDSRIEETEQKRNHKSDIVKEALYKHFNMEPPLKVKKQKEGVPKKIDRKVQIEDIANLLEKGELYDFPALRTVTGLSRTTIRRLVLDNPDWFEEQEKGANGKCQYLMIKEVLRPSRATEKRKKKRRKAKAKSKEAKANVDKTPKTYWKDRHGINTEYIKEPGKPERELGRVDEQTMDNVRMLRSKDKLITTEEMLTYGFMYYEEKPELFEDHFEYTVKQLEEVILPRREKVIKKVNKLLETHY